MDESVEVQPPLSDQPFFDPTEYGSGPDDSISNSDSNLSENAAVTHHSITINRATISYTARAGHLVTYDQSSARPSAKIFYVSFTENDAAASSRPVTFFYNGGPGSSSVFLLLGSFGPRRVKTSMPDFTPPAPYALENNADSLLDRTDLVFINPVGTGYSTAIAPGKNKDFWGVDQDAKSIRQFIKRYLTKYGRWNSPKFLFGESYGTPRTCVLTWLLHEDGIDLNGVVLQSPVLDYSQQNNSVGVLPTFVADALYHNKVTVSPLPKLPDDLGSFMKRVEDFARVKYAAEKATYTEKVDQDTVQLLSQYLGISSEVLEDWKLDPTIPNPIGIMIYLTSLLQHEVEAVGLYDGRVTANDTGIAGSVDPNSGTNDPSLTAVGGVYTTMWNVYMNEELKYMSTSPFMDMNDKAFDKWNWNHVDPTGRQTTTRATLYTAGDLAASMELNPYLKVFCANGYYDAATPFLQTKLDIENMPLDDQKTKEGRESRRKTLQHNLFFHTYQSGHMIYLDKDSRKEMKNDLRILRQDTSSPHRGRSRPTVPVPKSQV